MSDTSSTPDHQSIGDVLDRSKGIGGGFDFLRVALAIGVVAWHASTVARGGNLDSSRVIWFPGYAILVMFFALSGFLISGSAQRLSLRDFLINRSLRIFPALLVEITLSAFVLGPLFTELPWTEYFSQAQTYEYLKNIVGDIQYRLPGVFLKNPRPLVNWSLWTVPYELGCYAIISIFSLSGVIRKSRPIIAIFLLFSLVGLSFDIAGMFESPYFGHLAQVVFEGRGSRLVVGFVLGIVMFLCRYRVPYSPAIFAGCCAWSILAAVLGPASWLSFPMLNALVAPALVYMTIFIGASKVPPLPLFSRGDYSYGIYLYGMPIQ
jgi:peptidoglycan/LPS O-acetylase OafA/YrhL